MHGRGVAVPEIAIAARIMVACMATEELYCETRTHCVANAPVYDSAIYTTCSYERVVFCTGENRVTANTSTPA